MADNPTQTYCPVCERPIKTNARGLLHRHKAGTDRHTRAEVCPGSGQPPVDEATIIAAADRRLREALLNDPINSNTACGRRVRLERYRLARRGAVGEARPPTLASR